MAKAWWVFGAVVAGAAAVFSIGVASSVPTVLVAVLNLELGSMYLVVLKFVGGIAIWFVLYVPVLAIIAVKSHMTLTHCMRVLRKSGNIIDGVGVSIAWIAVVLVASFIFVNEVEKYFEISLSYAPIIFLVILSAMLAKPILEFWGHDTELTK